VTNDERERFAQVARVDDVEMLSDERGSLFEPVPDDELGQGRIFHVHLVECKPGQTRANHVHRAQTEVLCVVGGRFRVVVRDLSSGEQAECVFDASEPVKITMLPGVAHAFENVGDSDAHILGYSDRRFDASDIEPCAVIT